MHVITMLRCCRGLAAMAREKRAEELEVAKGRRAEASSDSAIQEPREALEIR